MGGRHAQPEASCVVCYFVRITLQSCAWGGGARVVDSWCEAVDAVRTSSTPMPSPRSAANLYCSKAPQCPAAALAGCHPSPVPPGPGSSESHQLGEHYAPAARVLTAVESFISAPLAGCSPCVLRAFAAAGQLLPRVLCTLAVCSAWHSSPRQPRFSVALVVPVGFFLLLFLLGSGAVWAGLP